MYINPYSFNILLHIYSDCVLCANMVYLPTYHKSYEFILKTVLLFSFHLLLLFTNPNPHPLKSKSLQVCPDLLASTFIPDLPIEPPF